MRTSRTIRVSEEVYAELERIQALTRLPISETATRALRFALDNSHLVEAQCYDIEFGICGKEGKKK